MIPMHRKLLPAALTLALLSPLAQAQTVATVNGKAITQDMLDQAVASIAKQSGHEANADMRAQVKQGLIMREVATQAAVKQGLDQDKDIKAELELSRQSILINALISNYLKQHPVTDAQVKAKYDDFVKNFSGTEYLADHILVPDQKLAKEIIVKLNKGAKFADLAKKYSKDSGSAAKGGELGWASPGNFIESFSAALVKLKPGETTKEPVQTQYGWHVIHLDQTRAAKPPTLDQLKPQITQEIQREAVQAYQKELMAAAQVTQ